jgi:hypothetical protein
MGLGNRGLNRRARMVTPCVAYTAALQSANGPEPRKGVRRFMGALGSLQDGRRNDDAAVLL